MDKKVKFNDIWKKDAGVRLLASGMIADGMLMIIACAAVAAIIL